MINLLASDMNERMDLRADRQTGTSFYRVALPIDTFIQIPALVYAYKGSASFPNFRARKKEKLVSLDLECLENIWINNYSGIPIQGLRL